MLRFLIEAEACENARGPGRGAVGIDGVQPVMDLSDAMWIGCMLDFIEEV